MLPLLPKFPEQGNLVITTGFNSNFGVVSSNWRLSAGNSREGVCLGATPGSNLTSLQRAEEGCALHLRTSHQSLGFPALSSHGSRRPLPPEGSSSAHLKLPPPWWGRREGRERPKLLAATGSPLPAVATVIAHRSTTRCRHQQRLRGTDRPAGPLPHRRQRWSSGSSLWEKLGFTSSLSTDHLVWLWASRALVSHGAGEVLASAAAARLKRGAGRASWLRPSPRGCHLPSCPSPRLAA